jgi:CheY-like chemotaxis protein
MPTPRLLVVEDNQDSLEALTVILSEKYRVFSYGCAHDALTALETAKPDLLLLDIGMSPIDGVGCLKAIRAVPGYGNIPAIALTGYARNVEREAFQAAGFQVVVTKPVLDYRKLFATITTLLAPLAAAISRSSDGDQGSEPSAITTAA